MKHLPCIQQTSQINESFTVMLLRVEFSYFIYQHLLNLNRLLTVR